VSERSAADGRDYGVVSLNNWRIGDLGVKHALLLTGLGWAACRSRGYAPTSRRDG
jgi:hypothetical protein